MALIVAAFMVWALGAVPLGLFVGRAMYLARP